LTISDKNICFDIAILGSGAAGLSLAVELADNAFKDKTVLILDQEYKILNDRTWCSWINAADRYDDICIKTWKKLSFFTEDGTHLDLEIAPYRYRMIRSADFYSYCYNILSSQDRMVVVQDNAIQVTELDEVVSIQTSNQVFTAKQVFTSIIPTLPTTHKYPSVLQHFKGWIINTPQPTFTSETATFMDFRLPQTDEVRFMYVLPLDEKTALIELAVFSNKIWQQDAYDDCLNIYIKETLGIKEYKVNETEFGVIPMTTYPFYKHNTKKIFHIGTAGGAVKASSGYAFKRILAHNEAIIYCLKNNQDVSHSYHIFKPRYKHYDATFLDVILHTKYKGSRFFYSLFKSNKASEVFDFLDEKTSIFQDIKLMIGTNIPLFARSFIKAFFKKTY
jgi:lycopene beta-cyclase